MIIIVKNHIVSEFSYWHILFTINFFGIVPIEKEKLKKKMPGIDLF